MHSRQGEPAICARPVGASDRRSSVRWIRPPCSLLSAWTRRRQGFSASCWLLYSHLGPRAPLLAGSGLSASHRNAARPLRAQASSKRRHHGRHDWTARLRVCRGARARAVGWRLRAFAEKEDELTFAEIAKQAGPAESTSLASPGQPPLWKTGYSAGTQASTAMFYLARYEQVHKAPYREALLAIADKYRNSVPEEDLDAWPLAFAHAISAQVAAYRLTDDAKYRDDAQRLARLAVRLFWQDNPLPRASTENRPLRSDHRGRFTGAGAAAGARHA